MTQIITLILLAALAGCTNATDAERALSAQGFSDIEITGYDWFACSEDEFYHTGFSATNPAGERVSGTVCSSLLFKNSTIRW